MGLSGKVYLVGAGPGDLKLVTIRAKELIETCDVLVYDYLANPRLLSWTRPGCLHVCVGKAKGRHSVPQTEIEALLVAHARSGKHVVRLKGGDPYVFGRGGEEAEVLVQNGIPFEVVPAVTAALGASAYAGIPVTHRLHSSSVCFLTGHEDIEKHQLHVNFPLFAQSGGTLCIYMGISSLAHIVEKLLQGGLSTETPLAFVQSATLPTQKVLATTLGSAVERAEAEGIGSPSVIFVGSVVNLSQKLGWYQSMPLLGRRIVVTRTRSQASELTDRLHDLGAEVLELPLIEVVEYSDDPRENTLLDHLGAYQWIVFTSPNGARCFMDKVKRRFSDVRVMGGLRIAAIGAATARIIREHHLHVDHVPEKAVGEEFARSLIAAFDIEHCAMLVVTGNRNRDTVVDELTHGKAIVETYQVYETQLTDLTSSPAAAEFRHQGADFITFTSSSTVDNFVAQARHLALERTAIRPKTASIGPVTSSRMREKGIPVDVEAPHASMDSLVDCILKALLATSGT